MNLKSTVDEVIDPKSKELLEPEQEEKQQEQQEDPFNWEEVKAIILAESPEKPIESYLDHPLNFNKSMGLAQVLRGLEGMFKKIRLAIFDVVVGFYRMSLERKTTVEVFSSQNKGPDDESALS